MFQFCTECNNIYDISKTKPIKATPIEQEGGLNDIDDFSDTPDTLSSTTSYKTSKNTKQSRESGSQLEEVMRNIINGTFTELPKEIMENFEPAMLELESYYKNLPIKHKELVFNTIQNLLPLDKKNINTKTVTSSVPEAYFICKQCSNSEPIKEGTIIINRISKSTTHDFEDLNKYKDLVHSNTLPITRHYICPNKNCESHTNHEKREAKFKRQNNSYITRYICCTCQTIWT